MNRNTNHSNFVLLSFTIIMIIVGALVISNVFFVMAFGYHIGSRTDINDFTEITVHEETIYARRGYIFDRNGNIIAQDSVSYNMIIVLDNSRPSYKDRPAYMPYDRIEEYATKLSTVLGAEYDYVYNKLNQNIYQTELGYYSRNISQEKKEEIEALGLYGIEFSEQKSRNYPLGVFASHLIGYTRYNEEDDIVVGEMGFESVLNDYLLGINGYSKYSQDSKGYVLLGTQMEYQAATNGNNVHLTLDRSCQEALEIVMSQTVDQFNASKMWGAVMEVETGKMLAWGCYPSFDPNTMEISNYLDLGSQYAYEPGSTMKTITYAAAIDTGNYNGDETYDSSTYYIGIDENGKLKRSKKATRYGTIVNAYNKEYGIVTYNQAFYGSLNTGIATLLEEEISPSILEEYLDKFGFFKKVNADGIYEVTGTKNMSAMVDKVASGYGQASSVTALQMMQAYSAIFNEGKMVKPYFVDYIQNPYTNEILYQGKTEIVGEPIKASTAKELCSMMRKVVTDPEFGTAGRYNVSEVSIIAKTGTGQVLTEKDSNTVIASIMMAFPAKDPKVMIYLAYQGRHTNQMHWATNPIKRFIRKIAKNLDLVQSKSEIKMEDEEQTENVEEVVEDDVVAYENDMPSVVNHTLDYAKQKLKDLKLTTVVLGTGDSVIKQYPEANTVVKQKQRVFLLTSTSKIQMPNMTGWSRKDIYAFWELVNIEITIEGNGYVTSQSIPKGTIIDSTDHLTLTLE